MECTAVIHAGGIRVIHGQDVVIFHEILIAVVIILAFMRDIMGRINVDLSVEDMGGRIRSKDMGYQRPALLAHNSALLCCDM
uniref:Uncharacterized protein n=1 Tax=uncultured bacterium Contig15 TaxID=1393441 RepID=W0FGR6_9BACT|nr:hypothetical protein [uncultured bacterium Contig15]